MGKLTVRDIDRGYGDPRWARFGYLHARLHRTGDSRPVDRAVLEVANRRRWDYDDLFTEILNNRIGRVWGEWAFSDPRHADVDAPLLAANLERDLGRHSDAPAYNPPVDWGGKSSAKAEQAEADTARRYQRQSQLAGDVAEAARRDQAMRRLEASMRYGRGRRRPHHWLLRDRDRRNRRSGR